MCVFVLYVGLDLFQTFIEMKATSLSLISLCNVLKSVSEIHRDIYI